MGLGNRSSFDFPPPGVSDNSALGLPLCMDKLTCVICRYYSFLSNRIGEITSLRPLILVKFHEVVSEASVGRGVGLCR